MRGTAVGDCVAVVGDIGELLHGTITEIATVGEPLRRVATSKGDVWAKPNELRPSDEPDRTKAIEDWQEGDVVVTFNGHRRKVIDVRVSKDGGTRRLARFEVPEGQVGWERVERPRGTRWYVLDAGGAGA